MNLTDCKVHTAEVVVGMTALVVVGVTTTTGVVMGAGITGDAIGKSGIGISVG